MREGESVLTQQSFGLANREQKLPHVADERFRIASITKLFAATLVMKAVDEGLVKLDESVSAYGTELAVDNVRQITPGKSRFDNYCSTRQVCPNPQARA